MQNNNRRDSRGDLSSRAAGWPCWVWTLAFAVTLSACQTLPPVTTAPGGADSTAIAGSPPDVAPAETPTRGEMRGPGPELRRLAVPRRQADTDLVGRIRGGLRLPPAQDPAVAAELDWFVARPDYLQRILARSGRYLHHIVESLERRDMPTDLALLPVVESAFDPFAYSHGRAAGLWQIIPETGRRLGLKQNRWTDERRDVLESTRAALDYLQYLNELFAGDWLLAVAGYNAGEGQVTRAIRRAEAAGQPTDFWHVRRHLPAETRTYVPRLLALQQLLASPHEYGVVLPAIPDAPYFEVVATGGPLDMALAAELAGLSTDELYRLNPGVNRWATDPDGPHRLLLPVSRAEAFAAALGRLESADRVRWSRHRVSAGDTLGELARAHQTTPGVLMEVNGLRSDMIRVGQDLLIPRAVRDLGEYTQMRDARVARVRNQPRDGERRAYVVRAGDTLWNISRRYDVTVGTLARWNAMAPGDVLPVGRELVFWTDTATLPPAQPERIRRLTYTVREGDSLYRISTRFRVSVAQLLEWNDLALERYLQPGQRLVMYVDVTKQTT